MQNFFIESEIFSSFIPVVFSILTETRNSFKKWPLNLWWTSNKTIMEIGNITKTASFKSFLYLSYKNTQLLLLWLCFLIFFLETKITNDFWGLHKNINCAFHLTFSCNSLAGLMLMKVFVCFNNCICFNSSLVSTQRLHHYLIVKAS